MQPLQLLEKPGALREACDIARQASMHICQARDLRRRKLFSTYCDCDLMERTRPVSERKLRVGTAVLLNEYYEASRHFKDCPLYVRSKAQRRLTAQFRAGIWPRLPMLVRASLACTTGAGGFSISPHLSFHVTVEESQAARTIELMMDAASAPREYKGRPIGDNVVVGFLESQREDLRRGFERGEVSPFERLPDGSTLLHVSYRH